MLQLIIVLLLTLFQDSVNTKARNTTKETPGMMPVATSVSVSMKHQEPTLVKKGRSLFPFL